MMLMKKVLWLRKMKDDFVFTANYTELIANMLLEEGYELHIYDFSSRKLHNFSSRNIEVICKWVNIFDKTFLRFVINFFCLVAFCIKYKNKYDIIHVLYVRIEYLFASHLISSLGSKLVLTIFGSDINYFVNVQRVFNSLYLKSDIIHTTITETLINFSKRFSSNKLRRKILNKSITMCMPLASLNIINSEQNADFVSGVFAKYKISGNDIIIVCGNTAEIKLEQLYLLVKTLSKTQINTIQEIKFFFLMTYGGNARKTSNFKKYICKALKSRKVIIIDEYLPLNELMVLRIRTDIFINVRKEDQLAGSMIEALFCNSDVITGDWLPYGVLKDNGIFYHPITKIRDVSVILPIIINERIAKINYGKLQANSELIMHLWGPEKALNNWRVFYNSLTK